MSDETVAQLIGLVRSLTNDVNGHGSILMEIQRKLDIVIAAFPEGGLVAHRMFHERQKEKCQDSRASRQAVKNRVMEWLTVGGLAAILVSLWEHILSSLRVK